MGFNWDIYCSSFNRLFLVFTVRWNDHTSYSICILSLVMSCRWLKIYLSCWLLIDPGVWTTFFPTDPVPWWCQILSWSVKSCLWPKASLMPESSLGSLSLSTLCVKSCCPNRYCQLSSVYSLITHLIQLEKPDPFPTDTVFYIWVFW